MERKRAKKKGCCFPKKKGNSMTPQVSDFNGYLLDNRKRVTMEVNGLKCDFHMPAALQRLGTGASEHIWPLPPAAPRAAFSVDEYPACPETWMHGSSKASSYFVPIKDGHGMWLDLNGNNDHTHHIAAVISVQGINPLTGKKTDVIRLEQYKDKCPVHNIEFQSDLFCVECKHKWPPQNYLSSNNGGPFWLDGFMASDGVVRQWIFTEEESKGVAAQIIKKERVFAIGIALYKSKQPKPPRPAQVMRSDSKISYCADSVQWKSASGVTGQSLGAKSFNKLYSLNYVDAAGPTGPSGPTGSGPIGPQGPTGPVGSTGSPGLMCDSLDSLSVTQNIMDSYSDDVDMDEYPEIQSVNHCLANDARGLDAEEKTSGGIPVPPIRSAAGRGRRTRESIPEKSIKKLEVGAGARIDQKIYRDPQNVDFWEDEPVGFIYVNYCTEEDANRIIAAGKREEAENGFLENIQLAK